MSQPAESRSLSLSLSLSATVPSFKSPLTLIPSLRDIPNGTPGRWPPSHPFTRRNLALSLPASFLSLCPNPSVYPDAAVPPLAPSLSLPPQPPFSSRSRISRSLSPVLSSLSVSASCSLPLPLPLPSPLCPSLICRASRPGDRTDWPLFTRKKKLSGPPSCRHVRGRCWLCTLWYTA